MATEGGKNLIGHEEDYEGVNIESVFTVAVSLVLGVVRGHVAMTNRQKHLLT